MGIRASSGLLALLAFASCSGGNGFPTTGPNGGNSSIAAIVVPSSATGRIAIQVRLVDPESELLSLQVEISSDGGASWRDATMTGSNLTGLASAPGGVDTTVFWDTTADLGLRNETSTLLRITPSAGSAVGAPGIVTVPAIDNLRTAAREVNSYFVQYGAVDTATVRTAEAHDLVILHLLSGNITPETVRDIQDGVDPDDPSDDVIVLGYISIGEDLRTVGKTDAELLLDSRFVGDGTGPRVDPRGPNADGQSLLNLDPLGLPSPAGTLYASWYLDDNSVDQDNLGDGKPDRNSLFGGCFVNAGDPKWYAVLDKMTLDGPDKVPGMQELLTTSFGRGFGCDGLFLDTVDTCAPNSFTDASSPNQSEFEWTAPGFRDFIARLRVDYPGKLILQNRGLFFFDSRFPHFKVTTRSSLDYVKFESFRLNSSTTEDFNSYFFPDNQYNVTPKLMAEAGRPDGFRVLSLGYAEGPSMNHDTLLGKSLAGFASLIEDITVTERESGFRHFLTDGLLTVANRFVLDYQDTTDAAPPTWTSTHNTNVFAFPTPPNAPTARVGIQEVVPGTGSLTVRWDVALDYNHVSYALYYQKTPFDFTADPNLTEATRVVLVPEVGEGYEDGTGVGRYPYEQTIEGLDLATTYYCCIRAFDGIGNEETNQTVIAAMTLPGLTTITIDGNFDDWSSVPVAHVDPADVPDSAGPDWLEIKIANDNQNLYIKYTSENAFNLDGSPTYGFSQTLVFIDADDDATTGYTHGPIGSELLVFGDGLYAQAGGIYNNGLLEGVVINPKTAITETELMIPLGRIYAANPGATRIRLLFRNDDATDLAPDSGTLSYWIIK